MIRRLAPLLCLLCACSPFQPPEVVQAIGLRACGAADMNPLAGKHFTQLARIELQGPLRVIYPDQVITRDIDPRRLNAIIDAGGHITALFCG